jgi:D-alanyl-D-alanine carboxypeptidase
VIDPSADSGETLTMMKLGRPPGARVRAGAAAAVVLGLLLAGCSSGAEEGTGSSSTAAPAITATRPAAPEGELSAELQQKLTAAVEAKMAEYDVPGAVAGVWIPGEGSWTTALGLANVDDELAAGTDMQWPLRSVTKSYTVSLILQLVDEGRLSLDDTIDQYVDGVTDGDEITLRQLADMSSGNSDYTNADFQKDFLTHEDKIYSLDELNSFALDRPAQFAPGTEKVYTNANTNLLGAVVEKVTGDDYADVLEERILDPLGQTGTEYILDATRWSEPHPTGYQPTDDGGLEPEVENASILGAAGSLFGTLDDARVWADTLGSGALLTPETQAARQEGAPLDAGPPYDQYALGIGETNGWWGHNGEGIGFTAAVFNDPETGASIVVLMNKSNMAPIHPADATFRELAAIVAEDAQ